MWVREKESRMRVTLETLFRRVRRIGPHGFWLDSGLGAPDDHSRFWAMAANPTAAWIGRAGDGSYGSVVVEGCSVSNPLEMLQNFVTATDCDIARLPSEIPIPLVVGSLSYEFGSLCEQIPRAEYDPLGAPDLFWARYGAVIVGDRQQQRVYIFGTDHAAMDAMEWALDSDERSLGGTFRLAGQLEPVQDDAQHQGRVARVLEYICAGDTYQVNIARRFQANVADFSDSVSLFAAIREKSLAPYAAYFELDDATIVSASPECLGRWRRSGLIQCFPIKGTIRRGASEREDARLKQRLLDDPKERAEHVMIVDLLRNDLGRVCDYGSVTVPDFCRVHTFAGLHHLISEVRGRLRSGLGFKDLVAAIFPGGSVTGAPKVRACEIIAELERECRGIYCGALGYVDARGGGCFNIPIRTAWLRNDTLHILSGGGIVADSTPKAETDETWLKIGVWREILDNR